MFGVDYLCAGAVQSVRGKVKQRHEYPLLNIWQDQLSECELAHLTCFLGPLAHCSLAPLGLRYAIVDCI